MAQAYPTRPVRFIVPYPPGGSTDPAARFIAKSMSRSFSQRVYVENRSGANGIVGTEAAARSAPDGYTVLVTGTAVITNPYAYKINTDPLKDLIPVIQLSRQPSVLAVHPASTEWSSTIGSACSFQPARRSRLLTASMARSARRSVIRPSGRNFSKPTRSRSVA
jgi:tripartite-type tricarboxylate transporter receptor subunit TctC